jgi:hypothetical protein
VAARALVAESAGEFEPAERLHEEAVQSWRTYEWPYEEAMALLGRARCLEALGRSEDARVPHDLAAEMLVTLGCPPPP